MQQAFVAITENVREFGPVSPLRLVAAELGCGCVFAVALEVMFMPKFDAVNVMF